MSGNGLTKDIAFLKQKGMGNHGSLVNVQVVLTGPDYLKYVCNIEDSVVSAKVRGREQMIKEDILQCHGIKILS